jgi:drug/metabolite transporter (DMT)-like permease
MREHRAAGPGHWVLLAIGVTAVTTSGPIIAAIAAPALAIAFWRNALSSGVLLPVALGPALRGRRPAMLGLDRRELAGCGAAGLLLAAHFACWVPSVTLTSVATSTALVCTQPVWTAVLAVRSPNPPSRGAWLGIGIAVLGAVLITGADLTVSGTAVFGDALALAGGLFAAGYVTAGERVRATVSTTVYTAVCYSVCAVVLLAVCLLAGVRLWGYPGTAWLLLAALTAGPQFLGHSVFNRVLDRISATVVSVSILLEVPGAALLALVFLHQRPSTLAIPGIALLLVGLAVVILGTRQVRVDPEL